MNVNTSDLKSIDYSQSTQETASSGKSQANVNSTGFLNLIKSFTNKDITENSKIVDVSNNNSSIVINNNESTDPSNGIGDINAIMKNFIKNNPSTTITKALSLLEDVGIEKTGKNETKGANKETMDTELSELLLSLLNSLNSMTNNNLQNNGKTQEVAVSKGNTTTQDIKTNNDLKLLLNKLNSFLNLIEDRAKDNIKLLEGSLGIEDPKEDLFNKVKTLIETTDAKDPKEELVNKVKTLMETVDAKDPKEELLNKVKTLIKTTDAKDPKEELLNKVKTLLETTDAKLPKQELLNKVKSLIESTAGKDPKEELLNKVKTLIDTANPKGELLDKAKTMIETTDTEGSKETVLNNISTLVEKAIPKDNPDKKMPSGDSEKLMKLLISNLNNVVDTEKLRAQLSSKDSNVNKKLTTLISNIEDTKLGSKVSTIVPVEIKDNTTDLKNKLVELFLGLSEDTNKIKTLVQSSKLDTNIQASKLLNKAVIKENSEVKTKDIKLQPNIESVKNSSSAKVTKEDKLLKTMLSDDGDSKINKVNVFMSQIKNANSNVSEIVTPEKFVINKNNLTQDILKVVKYMSLNDLKELTVKVNPKELGEIVIKLSMEAGNMKANISAQNKDTYNLLTSKLGDLTNSLNNNNNDIKMQNVDINIYQEDSTFFNENFRDNQQRENSQGRRNLKSNNGIEKVNSGTQVAVDENNLSILV